MKTILLVEDEESQRILFRRAFSDYKLKILTASQPAEAMFLMKRNSIDLLVLDGKLPGTNGFEFLKFLREGGHLATAKVIFITGVMDKDKVVSAKQMGADEYIVKPVNRDLLRQKVIKVMNLTNDDLIPVEPQEVEEKPQTTPEPVWPQAGAEPPSDSQKKTPKAS